MLTGIRVISLSSKPIPPRPDQIATLREARAQLSHRLLISLNKTMKTIDPLRRLSQEREQLFGVMQAGLGEDSAAADAIQLVRNAAQLARQRVDELRGVIGEVESAYRSPQRALAAEALGAELETLLALEGALFDAEIVHAADPIPRGNDTRLAGYAESWRRDLGQFEALHNRWREWQQNLRGHAAQERVTFEQLQGNVERINALWLARLQALAEHVPAPPAGDDPIAKLADALLNDATLEYATGKRDQSAFSQALAGLGDDIWVSATYRSDNSRAWSEARLRLRGLAQMEQQALLLANASADLDQARMANLAAADRFHALLRLCDALGVPWELERNGADIRASVSAGGERFVLEGLLPPGRMNFRSVAGRSEARRVAALDETAWQVAQLLAEPTTGVVPFFSGAIRGGVREVGENVGLYGLMVGTGVVIGGTCGAIFGGGVGAIPGGALGGLAGGGCAVLSGAAVDFGAGAIKGGVRGATNDPYTQEFSDALADTAKNAYALVTLRQGLTRLYQRGAGLAAGRARDPIAQLREVPLERIPLIGPAFARGDGIRRLLALLKRDFANRAASVLNDLNDAARSVGATSRLMQSLHAGLANQFATNPSLGQPEDWPGSPIVPPKRPPPRGVSHDVQLAQADCSEPRGSVAVWDEANDRPGCICPKYMAPNATLKLCIDCLDYEDGFKQALTDGDFDGAQRWLSDSFGCPGHDSRAALLAQARGGATAFSITGATYDKQAVINAPAKPVVVTYSGTPKFPLKMFLKPVAPCPRSGPPNYSYSCIPQERIFTAAPANHELVGKDLIWCRGSKPPAPVLEVRELYLVDADNRESAKLPAEMTCVPEGADGSTTPTPPAPPPITQRFDFPTIDGYRLDWCLRWATACGKGAADAFCRKKDPTWHAAKWEGDWKIGKRTPTKVIETGQICDQEFCDGFKYIQCVSGE